MFKIITLNGGGIRSVFTAQLLARIETEAPGFLDSADLIVGTSGGAIVAAALARYSAAEVVDIFRNDGAKIFPDDNFIDDIKDLFDLIGAKYPSEPLREVLVKYLGDLKLGDVKRKTLITAFDLEHESGHWQPVVFHNMGSRKSSPELSLVDAVMRSTAAPTYFPIERGPASKFIDGGVWSNNPSAPGLAAAVNRLVGNADLKNISMLNVGTMINPMTYDRSKLDLGALDWLKSGLIDILLDGSMESSVYIAKSMLGPNFHRLEKMSPDTISLDDSKKIQRLVDEANSVSLSDTLSWLQGFWV